uniref:Aquaporin-7 n=1 Tax=Balaenoptera musculus TaxID=9771 RepID=A0A8C0C7N4_BALMU
MGSGCCFRSTRMSKMVTPPAVTRMKAVLQKEMVREFLAEFLSTFVMMVFGLGAIAHMVLGDKMGSYLGVNLGFGFGVTMGVHMAGNISGAHMNAALTFTNCALGRMSWKKFPVYVLGQFLGSFLAAATIYCLFYTAIIDYSGGRLTVTGPTATANIFATYLPDHMTLWRGFLDEVLVTGMLQLCLLAITDKGNNPALQGTQALVIGILVVIIGASMGMNSGYAINPSRDLPPRFFTSFGLGRQVVAPRTVVGASGGPPLGAYLGAIIYLIFIGSSIQQEPQNHLCCPRPCLTQPMTSSLTLSLCPRQQTFKSSSPMAPVHCSCI